MDERKVFKFYKSYYDVYKQLDFKNKIAFMDALLERQFYGTIPDNLTGMAKFAYISQKHNIDAQVKGFTDKTGIQLDGITIDTPMQGGIEGGKEQGKLPPVTQIELEIEKKSNYIYNEFYDSEIEKLKDELFNSKMISEYKKFIAFIFGENSAKCKLTTVLKIEKQVNFIQYCKLSDKADFETICNKLYALQNNKKYKDKYSDLYMTLQNWLSYSKNK